MSSAYSPQTDGQSERTNSTMEVMLRSMVGYDIASEPWVLKLPIIEFAINSQRSESSQTTPFELLYGFNPRQICDLISPRCRESPAIESRELIRKEAIAALTYARATMARHYDGSHHDHNLKVGNKVFIENRASYRIPGLSSSKLAPRRFGPFEIKDRVGKNAFRLNLPNSYRIHDVISQRHLTKCDNDDWNRQPLAPPPILVDSDEQTGEFEVEKVLDSRTTKRGSKSYLVKWLGYPVHESTWISKRDSAGFQELIDEYLSTKPATRSTRKR